MQCIQPWSGALQFECLRHTWALRSKHDSRIGVSPLEGTLVELMVALFLLSVGILAVSRLFIFSQRHAFHGRTETQATALAEEIREKILSENFDDLVTIFDGVDTQIPETVTTPCQTWAGHLEQGIGPTGHGRIQVLTPLEDPEIVDGMVTVVIEISWEESGQERSLPVRFSISKMGV
jgi:hypothetical protein